MVLESIEVKRRLVRSFNRRRRRTAELGRGDARGVELSLMKCRCQ